VNLGPILFQPAALLAARVWVKLFGSAEQREGYGVLARGGYAYGLARAGRVARYFGKQQVTVCEFGVAGGAGLLAMISLAERLGREIGVEYRILGFDTGSGLPDVQGHKDHPELWSAGDFSMPDRDKLLAAVGGRARLVFGDIENTVDAFRESLTPEAPLGFVSVDVDIYSGSRSALRCLTGRPELYNPAVSMYFDDVSFFFANRWCGELAAIGEFNESEPHRKIDLDRSLPGTRPVREAPWYPSMHVCHVLDHEARQRPRPRGPLDIGEHFQFMRRNALY